MDPNVDEHSVMTYLSQFPKAKLKPGAPLRAKTLHPKRAKAYGPGKPPRQPPGLQPSRRPYRTCNDLSFFLVLIRGGGSR